jgi:chemotaxis protein MotB
MKINLAAGARAAPLIALLSAACVSQSAYQQQGQQLEEARVQAAEQQAQIAKMQQEQKWVVGGDLLFPEGGYQLGPNAQAALGQYVPRLQNLQNAKVVVYGYTDNVVAYFRSHGVNPGILSAKGFGDTHPVASNDTPQGRAQNRRIEIVLEGPGA